MPRLLIAEQIAGAANVEVVAGELEAGAEAVELGQHLQALLRGLGDRAVRRHRQIGVGACLGPADAAAQLVELRKAEAVGAIDDQRIRARDVESALDDRRRQKDVIFAVVESAHPLFDLGRTHLAVGGDELHLGHLLAQPFLDVGQVGDPWHDEEALPAADNAREAAPRAARRRRTA